MSNTFPSKYAEQRIYIVTRGAHQGTLCVARDNDDAYPFVNVHDERLDGVDRDVICDTGDTVPRPEPTDLEVGKAYRHRNGEDIVVIVEDRRLTEVGGYCGDYPWKGIQIYGAKSVTKDVWNKAEMQSTKPLV